MNYEDEINRILNSIEKTEILTFKETKEQREKIVDELFEKYKDYEDNYKNNFENKKKALKQLQDYMFIDSAKLNKGDYIRYFNLKRFFCLKLVVGGKVIDSTPDKNGHILVSTVLGKKSKIKPICLFKKIDEDTFLKMKLLEISESI